MDEYLELKQTCCTEQKQEWEKMLKNFKTVSERDELSNIIQSQKFDLFGYYVDLMKSLDNITTEDNRDFVAREYSNMFEKMIELAEFNGGRDLGDKNFKVRRGEPMIDSPAPVLAILGPGVITTGHISDEETSPSKLMLIQKIYFGKDITGIGDEACAGLEKLKNIYFHPDTSCKTIGNMAFSYCNLKEVILPDSVETLDYGCFGDCSSLEKVYTNKVKNIWHAAFYNCLELKKIHITDSVKLIGDECFAIGGGNEGGLEKITGMKNVEELGLDAFNGTAIKSFTGYSKLKRIGRTCFMNTPLQTLTLTYNPELTIGYDAFNDLDDLKIVNLIGGNPKKWAEKLRRQFTGCYEIHMLSERYQPQIEKIRELNNFDWEYSDEVIYIAYARILEQEAAQLMKGGSTKVPYIPSDITRNLTGFAPYKK